MGSMYRWSTHKSDLSSNRGESLVTASFLKNTGEASLLLDEFLHRDKDYSMKPTFALCTPSEKSRISTVGNPARLNAIAIAMATLAVVTVANAQQVTPAASKKQTSPPDAETLGRVLAGMLLAIAVFIDHDRCPALHHDLDQYEPVIGANFIQVAGNGIHDPPALRSLT